MTVESEPNPTRRDRPSVLYLVTAWRTILALTTVVVIAAVALGVMAYPFWDREPPRIVVTVPGPSVPADAVAAKERELGEISERIAALTRSIAEKRVACVPPPEPAREEPPPAETPAQQPEPEPRQEAELDCESTCRLCREDKTELQGDKSISLAWDSQADLDLQIVCPNGRKISFESQVDCGGKLNHDMNVNANSSTSPIENITLTESSPPGRYRVEVVFFKNHNGPLSEQFRVTTTLNGRTQKFDGVAVFPRNSIRMRGTPVVVTEFEIEPAMSPRPDATQQASFRLQCDRCNCGIGTAAPASVTAQ